jgi:hypothetical protein
MFFVVNMGDLVGCRYGSETEIVISTLFSSDYCSQVEYHEQTPQEEKKNPLKCTIFERKVCSQDKNLGSNSCL